MDKDRETDGQDRESYMVSVRLERQTDRTEILIWLSIRIERQKDRIGIPIWIWVKIQKQKKKKQDWDPHLSMGEDREADR